MNIGEEAGLAQKFPTKTHQDRVELPVLNYLEFCTIRQRYLIISIN